MPEIQKAIQAMLKALSAHGNEPMPAFAGQPVICISRDYGSGGDEAARQLAERLQVQLYDRDILDRIAERLDAEPEVVRAFSEGASRLKNLWLYSLMTGHPVDADSYRSHLVNVIISIGRGGGVILGRAAHLVLAKSGALRVRITGSPEACAARVSKEEGLSLDAARRKVAEENARRAAFVSEHFQQDINDARTFDLVVNTDHVERLDKLVDMLVFAMGMMASSARPG